MSAPASTRPPLRRRVLLGLVAAAAVLGVAELGAQLVLPAGQPPPGIALQEDPDILWTLSSGGGHAPPNRLGLRGAELPARDTVDARILTLGDSSVYGDTVRDEEVYSAVAARRLSALGCRVDAANGGVPGYSSVQAQVLYGRVHAQVRADVVIVGTLWSDAAPGEETDVAHIARVRADLGTWGPVNRAFRAAQNSSALFRAVRQMRYGNFSFRAPTPPRREKVGWVHAEEDLPIGTFPRVPPTDYRANLEALVAAVRADGALPVFLLLPHPYDDLGLTLPERLLRYRRAMRESAVASSVPLVDGEAWFKAHPSGGTNRFSDDIHPNAQGHAAIAEAVVASVAASPPLTTRLRAATR
ncbi:MAG: GDSL-type esterase/lipase family protein [Pseudomonadota bacterium]|nr:GDSL-type esterase/lipase family protein [Pseudomonadota bacterium]